MSGLFDRIQADLDQRERMEGLSPVDLLDLPDGLRELVLLLARKGELDLPAIAEAIGAEPEAAGSLLEDLEDKGFVLQRDIQGVAHYRTYFGQRRRRDLPVDIWATLRERSAAEEAEETGAEEDS